MTRSEKSFTFTPIADTKERFSDFAPYVASINDAATVAFQAALRSGGTGVFTGSGGPVLSAMDNAAVANSFCSHPDINKEGSLCVYGALPSGVESVFFIEKNNIMAVADTQGRFSRIGPLGPTMNDDGVVAFRADLCAGGCGIFTRKGDAIVCHADTTRFAGFQGLPVVNGHGAVVFRADLKNGGEGIYVSREDVLETIVESGGSLRNLGFFPCINDEGTVVFSASLERGGSGIFSVANGRVTTLLDTNSVFESFRGALISNAGKVVFYATPRGGQLGIYAISEQGVEAIVSFGDSLFDSSVVDLALNPVSINARGQLALRLRLDNGLGLIVRVDPTA